MTAVGFEPTPLRNGALSHRLRPLGHTVLVMERGDYLKHKQKPLSTALEQGRAGLSFLPKASPAYDGKSAKYLLVEGDLADPL